MTADLSALIARLEKRADHYARRAAILATFADGLPVSDPYRVQADADADNEHCLAADMREVIAILLAKQGERE